MAHREALNARIDASSLSRYYPALGGQSSDPAMVGKLRAYAQAHLDEGSRRPVDAAVAGIEYRNKVRNERLPAVDAWLQRHGG
jgi:aminopeptidase N